jgi:hypothetical protein
VVYEPASGKPLQRMRLAVTFPAGRAFVLATVFCQCLSDDVLLSIYTTLLNLSSELHEPAVVDLRRAGFSVVG